MVHPDLTPFTALQLTSLHFISPTINTLHGTPRFNPLHCTTLHFTSQHFTSPTINTLHGTPRFNPLHCTTLHFNSLHFLVSLQPTHFPFSSHINHSPNPLSKSTWFRGESTTTMFFQKCSILTRSNSKVTRLIFFWLYWQYCSPLTQTAIDLDPSSIPNCSGMALQ